MALEFVNLKTMVRLGTNIFICLTTYLQHGYIGMSKYILKFKLKTQTER